MGFLRVHAEEDVKFETILLPTDGRPGSGEATTRALDLARATDATVHTLSVVDTSRQSTGLDSEAADTLRQQLEERCQTATAQIVERANELGVECVPEVRSGVPHTAILAYADEHDVDLVVMATHNRTGAESPRFGSTTERVITLGEIPVMTVPVDGRTDVPEGYGMYDHVVIATDGSDTAEQAASHGIEIAQHYGADVHAAYVVDTATYDLEDAPRSIVGLLKEGGQQATEAVAAEARELNLPAEADVLRGRPEQAILEFADGVDADLVVLGARGRGTAPDRLLGSVTARVIERAEMPVLTR